MGGPPRPSMTGAASRRATPQATAVLQMHLCGLQRRLARAGLAVVQEHRRRRLWRHHGHWHGKDLWAALAGTLRSSCDAICRVLGMPQFMVLHFFVLNLL